MRRGLLLATGVLFGSSLVFAGDQSKGIHPEQGRGIAWQDYAQATKAAKKANRPVLVDFWRPG